jgi:dephospho-CoA kinase
MAARLILGLAGGYCSGKSQAAALLAEAGFSVFDADQAGHGAIESEKDKIIAAFGSGILSADGKVDRGALAALVFRDTDKLQRLEAIVHPAVNRMAEGWIAAHPKDDLAIHAALLHAMPTLSGFDAVIEIQAGLWARLRRGMSRDGRGALASLRRIANQRGFAAKLRRAAGAAGVSLIPIKNDGTRRALEEKLKRQVERLRRA